MKAPTSLFDRPGRAAAVVGGVVAISATAAVALVGTATAVPTDDESGRCTKNVNVRAEPDVTSRIVGLCEQGTEVQVGESRDGFLQLKNLGGWAAQEFVSVDGRAPAPAGTSEGEPDGHDGDDNGHGDDDNGDDDNGDDDGRRGHGGDDDGHRGHGGDDGDDDNGDDDGHRGHGDDDNGDDDGDGHRGHGGHGDDDGDDGHRGHGEGGETGVRIG